MTQREDLDAVLETIRTVARTMPVEFDPHAERRMFERGIRRWEAIEALENARRIRRSDADNRSDWTVTGPDEDGDDVTFGVSLRVAGNVYVVTVY